MIAFVLITAASQVVVTQPPELAETVDPCASSAAVAEPTDEPGMMTVEELAELADLGRPMADQGPSAFGISPDGQSLIVHVNRAAPKANAYCQQLLVIPLSGSGPAREVARGGDFDFADFPLRDFSVVYAGWQKANPPQWSPDGSLIAYLRRENGSTQVWLADPAGHTPPLQATRLPADVDAFAWTRDSSSLVVATRPGVMKAARAISREGLHGYLFDERFSPQFANHPIVTGPVESEYTTISLADGAARHARLAERKLVEPTRPEGLPGHARLFAAGVSGQLAWLEPREPEFLLSPSRLVRKSAHGDMSSCEGTVCEGIFALWWTQDGSSLLALQRTGWARSKTALLRWQAGEPIPRRIMATNDVLTGCQLSGPELLCGREGSTQPRRLVAIDIHTGAERVIHDPNPEIGPVRMGRVERFLIRNAFGVESFADLVLPPDHHPGQRHPLVVVQYESRGFLRGGTGNEMPIHPLASRGFAVLSFHRPGLLPAARAARNVIETRTLIEDPWADRAQILSSLELAIRRAIETGLVDPERIGISGFSDGGGTVQFALINSDLFKVASLGTCCEDLGSYALAAGPGFTDFLREMGYPLFEKGGRSFWQPVSLLLNVDKIDVPILIQASDSEYEGALDVVATYRRRGRPIEMFVFPGETHFKWQPAHRLAIFERNMDWFEFWLAHRIDCDPSKSGQYARWMKMAGAPEEGETACTEGGSVGPEARPVRSFQNVENALDQR